MRPDKRKLLLVDDDATILKALQRTLVQDGLKIQTATCGPDALNLLREEPADMIICDQHMPGMTGLHLLKTIRAQWPDTMRILLTGAPDVDTATEAINQGEVYRLFNKPWDVQELRVSVSQAFDVLELRRENKRLLGMVDDKQRHIACLERSHLPGSGHVDGDDRGAIEIEIEIELDESSDALVTRTPGALFASNAVS